MCVIYIYMCVIYICIYMYITYIYILHIYITYIYIAYIYIYYIYIYYIHIYYICIYIYITYIYYIYILHTYYIYITYIYMGLSINGQSPIAGWFIIVNFHPTAGHAGNAGHGSPFVGSPVRPGPSASWLRCSARSSPTRPGRSTSACHNWEYQVAIPTIYIYR